jgi:uncharacterized spore protein YtfJ
MTEGPIPTPSQTYYTDPALAVTAIQDTMEIFIETANVNSVYGEPTLHGDTLIIPAAEVLAAIGFGAGFGGGIGSNGIDEETNDEENNEKSNSGSGSGGGGGGGGGGRTFARPVAVIIASSDGVRVEPVVDVTKIALAMFTAAGFMAAMALRMLSPKHALKELSRK